MDLEISYVRFFDKATFSGLKVALPLSCILCHGQYHCEYIFFCAKPLACSRFKVIQQCRNKKKRSFKMAGCLAIILNSCTWIVALLVVPISLFCDFLWWAKARIAYSFYGGVSQSRHDEKVKQPKALYFSINNGSTYMVMVA